MWVIFCVRATFGLAQVPLRVRRCFQAGVQESALNVDVCLFAGGTVSAACVTVPCNCMFLPSLVSGFFLFSLSLSQTGDEEIKVDFNFK